uniref:Uncharacterized protein n=1 Tax=viral metagenome TaxID=1070528 RepID=A0A6M3KSP9_9ZZZZ
MARKLEFIRSEVEEFVNTRMWKYIVATIVERTSSLMEKNNQIDPFTDPTSICRNQGMIAGLGEIVDLPAVMVEQIEFEKTIKEEKEDDRTSE